MDIRAHLTLRIGNFSEPDLSDDVLKDIYSIMCILDSENIKYGIVVDHSEYLDCDTDRFIMFIVGKDELYITAEGKYLSNIGSLNKEEFLEYCREQNKNVS